MVGPWSSQGVSAWCGRGRSDRLEESTRRDRPPPHAVHGPPSDTDHGRRGDRLSQEGTPHEGIHSALARQGLTRSSNDRIIAGVCSGLATKLGIDAWAMRAIVIATMLLLPGSQIILYPLAWILMPEDTYVAVDSAAPQDQIRH